MSEGTTYEEAKLCPRCGKTGRVVRITKTQNMKGKPVDLHLIACTTELCPWFETTYVIQVNEDGSIPEKGSGLIGSDKAYPKLSQESVSRIEDNIRRQLEAETSGDEEQQTIRNRNA